MERDEVELTETEHRMPASRNDWTRQLILVLVSSALSSLISVAAVSIGWKASIDTFSAVTTVKMNTSDDRIKQLESDHIKSTDLAYRDQLMDAKLAALTIKIDELKEQISNLPAVHGAH
jgi:hypothetical protein